jgi:soluble lytic murein transglycosylase-like protein
MQIKAGTARALGYAGSPAGLLDVDTNLTYGVRYLAGAYRVANGEPSRAVAFFARGYYYDAKRKGMLASLKRKPSLLDTEVEEAPVVAQAEQTGATGGVFDAAPSPYLTADPK